MLSRIVRNVGYKAARPEGFPYSWVCQAYRAWAATLDLVMRQPHRAGETRFVEYAGQGLPVVNSTSGALQEAASFIAVLGASHSTYAAAPWRQALPDWLGSHVRAFAAQRALTRGTWSYKSLASLLKHGRDQRPVLQPPAATAPPWHAKIRGPQDYHADSGERSCAPIPRWTHSRPGA